MREESEYPLKKLAQAIGYRSFISVPMLRGGSAIGTKNVAGAEPAMFSERQIALLETFADQAVIAIENTRLFQELQSRTQELVGSVQRLRSLAEVSQAVNSTLDIDQVLNTIVARPVELSFSDAGPVLSNAVKFTPKGGRVRLQAEQVNDSVLVSVIDNGVGISAVDQE